MKATLTFELPEEEPEFTAAHKGTSALALLRELDEWLRQRVKYDDLPEEVQEAYAKTRQWLASEVEERGLPIA